MRGYLQICGEGIEMRRALAKRGLESCKIIYLAIVALIPGTCSVTSPIIITNITPHIVRTHLLSGIVCPAKISQEFDGLSRCVTFPCVTGQKVGRCYYYTLHFPSPPISALSVYLLYLLIYPLHLFFRTRRYSVLFYVTPN